MTRGNRGKPSSFRLVLSPEGGQSRTVECARAVQNLTGAKQAARSWAADVGAKGTITVEQRVDLRAAPWFQWRPVAVGDVVKGALKGWR